MNKSQEQVREFHEAFELEVRELPTYPSDKLAILRGKLIIEEAKEVLEALGLGYDTMGELKVIGEQKPLSEVAKELADLKYVVEGAFVSFGIDGENVFDEVHRSNMSKVGGTKNADGKLVKPDTYSKADIETVLRFQYEHSAPK